MISPLDTGCVPADQFGLERADGCLGKRVVRRIPTEPTEALTSRRADAGELALRIFERRDAGELSDRTGRRWPATAPKPNLASWARSSRLPSRRWSLCWLRPSK